MKKVFIVGFIMLSLVVVTIPQFAFAQNPKASVPDPTVTTKESGCSNIANNGLTGVAGCVIKIFNIAIYLIISTSVVYIMYGAFNMIASEEKREAGKLTIYYGIIGLFVMVSIWGFVNILVSTFGLSSVTSDKVIPENFFKSSGK